MKKIIFFLDSLNGGGAERTVVNIINKLDKQLFDVVLLLGKNKNNDYKDQVSDDVRIEILDIKKYKFGIFKIAKFIRKENPDLLFSTINSNNIVLILSKIISLRNIPIIVREASFRSYSDTLSPLNIFITFFLYNFFASKVVSLSNGVKKELVNKFRIKENKITVIYNPVDICSINKLSNEEISDYIFEKGKKNIIGVGRLVYQKDFETLIRAFNIIQKKTPSKLLILGRGPLEHDLKELCEDLEIRDKVTFGGFKKNPYKYMKQADIFILSSKWEGFGHVIVEAMATGIPVISTNCNSGPAEILKNGEYGRLVKVGDYKGLAEEAVKILDDKKLSEKYSMQGLSRAYAFKAEKIVKEYEKIIIDTLK